MEKMGIFVLIFGLFLVVWFLLTTLLCFCLWSVPVLGSCNFYVPITNCCLVDYLFHSSSALSFMTFCFLIF